MTTMVSEVYDAFKSAGAPEGAAHAAATAVADAQNRLDRMDSRIRLLYWMIAGVFAFQVVLYLQPWVGAY